MRFSKIDFSKTPIKEFRISGCREPSEKEPQPQVYASTVFAVNSVMAQSKFLKFLNEQYKIKSRDAVVLETNEIEQDKDFVMKNYGITLVYRTGSIVQNGYKEIRSINRALAVADMYQEIGTRHKVKASEIDIVSIVQVPDAEVTKAKVLSYVGKDVMFPVFINASNTEEEMVPSTTDIFI